MTSGTTRIPMNVLLLLAAACSGGCDDPPRPTSAASQAPITTTDPDGAPAAEKAPAVEVAWRTLRSADGGFVVRWRPLSDPIPTLDPFSLEVEIYRDESLSERISLGDVRVDAAMPHHGHGMNVAPRVTSLGDGRYRVDAMLFHMGGRWELFFDHVDDLGSERAQTTIVLP